MAERIFKKKSGEKARNDIGVSSASVFNMGGAPADSKAVEILEREGIAARDHYSRLLTEEMIVEADWILVMEQQHREVIIWNYPDAGDKVFLLKPFTRDCFQASNDDRENIKDPHHLSDYHYRLCFAEISLAVEGLLKCV